ncbi:MAG: ABC transporter permease [Glaciimonas sp.]|nr:ABC transporter permease [Glaciimonas sp.]
MQNFSASPREMVASLWRNRQLIRNLIQREVLGRYKGSVLGIFWSLVTPIFMLAVYTFVFSVVFKARWGAGGSDSKTEFALVLFAGLMVFNLFAECIGGAPGLILGNVNYVKKVIFPLEVLPWVRMGSALFNFAISIGVWLLAYLALFGIPHWQVLLLPLVVLPLVLFVMGLSWVLSSLGVYLRDVSQIINLVITVLMFLTPIFFPASSLPQEYQALMFLNPLTPPVEMARNLLYWGQIPNLTILTLYTAGSIACAALGFAWFQKTRKGFADVL